MRRIVLSLLLLACTSSLPQMCKELHSGLADSLGMGDQSQLQATKKCLAHLIQNGQYESLDQLQQLLTEPEELILTQLLNEQITRLKAIHEYVILTKTTCEPVLKWAQNKTHVFIAAKLSHRWDSPPCLKSIKQDYRLQDSILVFNNVCLVSNAQITFAFDHKLHRPANDTLQVKKDGVGTYSLTFEKQQQEVWLYLFQREEKIQMWPEIMGRDVNYKGEYEKKLAEHEAAASAPPKNWAPSLGAAAVALLLALHDWQI